MTPSKTEQAFLEAYDTLADALFRHSYFRVFDRERAKDIVQEAFVKTWQYVASGKHVENLRAFLYRVVNNVIIDQSRKRKEQSLDMLLDEGFDIGTADPEMDISRLDARRITQYLEELDAPARQLIVMRYIDDLGPRDIANITGESENVISVRIHRALAKLRIIIARHEPIT